LWIDHADPSKTYEHLLERREIANFFRYIEILNENAGGTGKIRQLPVPTIGALTLQAIHALTV